MAGAVLVAMFVLVSASNAAAQSTTVEFNIPAQPISSALRAYAHQAKVQLLVMTEGLNNIQANEVVGRLDPRTALQMLLAGTGLHAEYRPDATIAVGRGSATEGPLSSAGGETSNGQPDWFAQAGHEVDEKIVMAQATLDGNPASRSTETNRGKDAYNRPLEEIVVTGTNIRGIAPESSPARTFTREDIDISGTATAGDFIKTLTTNFGGGANANIPTAMPNDNSGGANAGGFGSFGSSVNLHGLGSGSTLVLLNGHRVAPSSFNADFTDISMIPASAIDRVETLTGGASSIYGSDAVAGVVNFILRDDFEGLETSVRYGTGTQHGTPDQSRANVTGGGNWGSGNALFVYEFFNQQQLSVDDRRFAQKDVVPNYLLPSQKRQSVLVSTSQNVAPDLEIFGDLTFSNRKAGQLRTIFGNNNTLKNDTSSDNLNVSAGGAWNIFGDWFFDFSGTYSEVDTHNNTSISLDRLIVTDSDMWIADAKLSGSIFHLSGGDVKLALGGHYRTESFLATQDSADTVQREATRDVYALFGEAFIPIVGPENRVAGIERLELNVSGRLSDYSDFGSTSNPKVGLLWSPADGLNLRASYSTSFKAPPLGRVGDKNLVASALNTSFLNSVLGLTAPDPSLENAVVLTVTGTAKDLDPETSEAFTAGLDFQHQWASDELAFSATWFNIDFKGRLGVTPIPGNVSLFQAVNIAFVTPEVFPAGTVVFSPTVAEIGTLLDSLDSFANPFGDDPFDAVAINFAPLVRNLGRTKVSGIDFDLTYTHELGTGSVFLGLDGSFLQDVQRQAATTTPLVETVDTLFNPVGQKLRGRAGYSGNTFTANVFVNFADSYHVDSTTNSEPMESWTTIDVSLAYDISKLVGDSILDNTVFRMSVINLMDEDPPAAPIFANLAVDGFDPTNASPLGRFIALEITKHW